MSERIWLVVLDWTGGRQIHAFASQAAAQWWAEARAREWLAENPDHHFPADVDLDDIGQVVAFFADVTDYQCDMEVLFVEVQDG